MSLNTALSALEPKLAQIDPIPLKVEPPVSPAPIKTLEETLKPAEPAKPIEPAIGADRFAALARKERQIQKQLSEVKAREAKAAEWETLKASASQNPIKALEALGITYEQLTSFILGGGKPTADLEVKAVRDEVAKLRQEQADKERKAAEVAKERAEREYKATLAEFESEVNEYLATNKDTYELTTMYDGQAIVLATIEQHFANTKKVMTIKEASDLVEQYFEDQVKKAQASKKFQGSQAPKKDGQSIVEASAKTSAPTLTNGMTSSAPSLLSAKTENDRIARAMAALSK